MPAGRSAVREALATLGAESNHDLLIHFLNAVLGVDLPRPIVAVETVRIR